MRPPWARFSGTPWKGKGPISVACGPFRTGTCATSSIRFPESRRSLRSAATRSNTRSTSIPNKLRAYGVTLGDLYAAVGRSNSAVGGRVIHKGNAEYLIRGVGWIGTDKDPITDIKNIVVKTNERTGTPIYVSNLATVSLGTQFRRSVLEKNGNEVVGGVCMMRYGENPLAVTKRIKQKIEQLQAGLPAGVRIVPFYDRTRLIHGAIHTLTEILTHETIIASVAVLLILMHVGSAFVICVTLPLAVLVSFILMRLFGIPSQHHVAGRNRNFDRHSDRPGDRHGRERDPSSHRAFRQGESAGRYARADHSRLPDGGAADLLLGDDYPDLVSASVSRCTAWRARRSIPSRSRRASR